MQLLVIAGASLQPGFTFSCTDCCAFDVQGICLTCCAATSYASRDRSPEVYETDVAGAQGFEAVKSRTSTLPFQAIWQGRQQLPADYYKEFLRLPYLTLFFVTLGAYWAHPLMQLGSYKLGW